MSNKMFRCFWGGAKSGVITLFAAVLLLFPAAWLISAGKISPDHGTILCAAVLFVSSALTGAIFAGKEKNGLVGSLFCGIVVTGFLALLGVFLACTEMNGVFALLNCAIATIGNYTSSLLRALKGK